jgi:TetR/AcrR family transcriptional repressor of mexJK operon
MTPDEMKDEKRERILEIALKRFTHYGMEKTTMSEIADDLGASKASLYYYFPDKKGLCLAVTEKLFEGYFDDLTNKIKQSKSADSALLQVLEVRHDLVRRHFLFLMYFKQLHDNKQLEQFLDNRFRLREKELVADCIQEGVWNGDYEVVNVAEAADVYLDVIESIPMLMFKRDNYKLPDAETFSQVMRKTLVAAHYVIRGFHKAA